MMTILEELGLIRNKSKSFTARGGVFCECFLPPSCDTKESFKRRECLLPLTASNIVHAKSMFTLINLEFVDNYYGEIVRKFGYEFYPEEHEFTPEFGGWIPFKINRLNTDLLRMEDIYEAKFCKSYFACKEKISVIRRKDRDVPINNFLGIDNKTVPEICKRLNIDSLNNLHSKFYIPFYDQNADLEWTKLYKRRQKIYHQSPRFDYKTFCKFVLQESINFYPPEFAIERKVKLDLYEDLFFNYYDYGFPICSALRALKGIKEQDKPSTLFFLLKDHSEDYSEQGSIRKILATLNLENFVNIYDREYSPGLFLPQNQQDLDDLEDSYFRPFDITYFCGQTERLAPILFKEYRPNTKMREEVFGRKLLLHEIINLTNLPWRIVKFFVDMQIPATKLESVIAEFNKLRSEKHEEVFEFEAVEEEEDFDWSTVIVSRKERPYVVYEDFSYYENPTEEELVSYMLDNIFINNVNLSYHFDESKAPIGKALRLFLMRNKLASNLDEIMTMRQELNQKLIDFLIDDYPDIYTFLFQETGTGNASEEEVDFAGDFDMFE